MLVNGELRTSIWTDDDHQVWIIDQRWLPHEVVFTELTSLDDFYNS
ncbi:MAG: S-methyl-5-thioribose-1-phosphate isomerase, partial [Alphaproteobacteria bacterium]|nr:S-methyl-5-thioribose-1-phosphate isomerase [Alphaproteobacteria bacterium]